MKGRNAQNAGQQTFGTWTVNVTGKVATNANGLALSMVSRNAPIVAWKWSQTMGKGDKTRARARKAMQPLPELATTPRKQPNGRTRERRDSPNDPRKTALGARCRMFGVKDTRQNREALSGQHSGSELGMIMQAQCRASDIPRLWMVWQNLCAVERTYRLRILGMTGDAKGANIAMVPDRMETDQSHSVDLRDSDERDRAAVNAWTQMRGHIGQMPARSGSLLLSAERGSGKTLWDSGPTKAGVQTLGALVALADIVERG